MPIDLRTHPDTEALVEVLRAVPRGGKISYAELTAAIGRDVTGTARTRLASARRIALRDHGAAFETRVGTGLRRLMPDEAPEVGAAARRRIRRTSSSARRAMRSIAEHSNGLSPDAARRMSAEMSAHGLLGQIATDKVVAAVAARADRSIAPARVAETFLEHLRGAKPKEA